MSGKSWNDAYEDFIGRVMPALERRAAEVQADAHAGDALAVEILGQYRKLYSSFELEAAERLEQALTSWLAANPEDVTAPPDESA